MNLGMRITSALMLAAMSAACSPPQSSDEHTAAQPPESASVPQPVLDEPRPMPLPPVDPPATSATGATQLGSMIVYTCDDGSSLTVTYDQYSALVKLPAGSTMLSRAEALSGSGDEAYLGEELSLYRNGNLVQLQVAGKTRACSKSSA